MLVPGDRLGPYEIRALVGVGGMGEVYRALDTRLGRTVAIKILSSGVASDPDLRQRFEREAKAVSHLNHPNICTLFDVGHHDGREFLVMEYLEGETLAERLAQGPLTVEDAVRCAIQIAAALDAAHERGIVHRDLKPANVKITAEGIKLLDFGLAKLLAAERPGAEQLAASPVTSIATRVGTIMGTAGYMSPEQARGQPVDKRTDIWAFGCVLYEMLTGKPAFDGNTGSDRLAAVLERDPRWEGLPARARGKVRGVLEKCLRKDPGKRLRDIGDACVELEEALAGLARHRSYGQISVVAGLLGLATLSAAALWLRSSPADALIDPARWVALTSFADSATQPALSADDRMLTFIRGPGTFTTTGEIYVKQLPDGEAVPLTNDGLVKMSPVFSPDGAQIAYTVNSPTEPWNTWSVSTLRGSPRRWLHNASGLTWTPSGELLFSEIEQGTGSHMGIIAGNESRTSARDVYWPSHVGGMAHRSALSPDGRSVLLVEMDPQGVWLPCRLVPSDGSAQGTQVGPPRSRCTYVAWAPSGDTMYFSADGGDGFQLWRQRFPDGTPEQITRGPTSVEGLATASDGRWLVTSVGQQRRAVWLRDSSGERQITGEGYAFYPLFSADGQHIVFRRTGEAASGQTPSELWAVALASGIAERILPGHLVTGFDVSADNRVAAAVRDAEGESRIWLTRLDGREAPRAIPGAVGDNPRFGAGDDIFFVVNEGGSRIFYRIDSRGEGRRRASAERVTSVFGTTSPDGRWISAAVARGPGERSEFALLSTDDSGSVLPFFPTVARLRWSPDGRSAYVAVQQGDASAFATGRNYVLPVDPVTLLPAIPADGFRTEEELAAVPGVEILPYGDVALSPKPGVYAYSRETISRNLYRIPLE